MVLPFPFPSSRQFFVFSSLEKRLCCEEGGFFDSVKNFGKSVGETLTAPFAPNTFEATKKFEQTIEGGNQKIDGTLQKITVGTSDIPVTETGALWWEKGNIDASTLQNALTTIDTSAKKTIIEAFEMAYPQKSNFAEERANLFVKSVQASAPPLEMAGTTLNIQAYFKKYIDIFEEYENLKTSPPNSRGMLEKKSNETCFPSEASEWAKNKGYRIISDGDDVQQVLRGKKRSNGEDFNFERFQNMSVLQRLNKEPLIFETGIKEIFPVYGINKQIVGFTILDGDGDMSKFDDGGVQYIASDSLAKSTGTSATVQEQSLHTYGFSITGEKILTVTDPAPVVSAPAKTTASTPPAPAKTAPATTPASTATTPAQTAPGETAQTAPDTKGLTPAKIEKPPETPIEKLEDLFSKYQMPTRFSKFTGNERTIFDFAGDFKSGSGYEAYKNLQITINKGDKISGQVTSKNNEPMPIVVSSGSLVPDLNPGKQKTTFTIQQLKDFLDKIFEKKPPEAVKPAPAPTVLEKINKLLRVQPQQSVQASGPVSVQKTFNKAKTPITYTTNENGKVLARVNGNAVIEKNGTIEVARETTAQPSLISYKDFRIFLMGNIDNKELNLEEEEEEEEEGEPKLKEETVEPKDMVYIGDSVALGLGVSAKADIILAGEGRNPDKVLQVINGIKDIDLRGKVVVLSSGLLNNTIDGATVKEQIKVLQQKGVKKIILAGGPSNESKRTNLLTVKNILKDIAQKNPTIVSFMGEYKDNGDGIHPKYADYINKVVLKKPPTPQKPETSKTSLEDFDTIFSQYNTTFKKHTDTSSENTIFEFTGDFNFKNGKYKDLKITINKNGEISGQVKIKDSDGIMVIVVSTKNNIMPDYFSPNQQRTFTKDQLTDFLDKIFGKKQPETKPAPATAPPLAQPAPGLTRGLTSAPPLAPPPSVKPAPATVPAAPPLAVKPASVTPAGNFEALKSGLGDFFNNDTIKNKYITGADAITPGQYNTFTGEVKKDLEDANGYHHKVAKRKFDAGDEKTSGELFHDYVLFLLDLQIRIHNEKYKFNADTLNNPRYKEVFDKLKSKGHAEATFMPYFQALYGTSPQGLTMHEYCMPNSTKKQLSDAQKNREEYLTNASLEIAKDFYKQHKQVLQLAENTYDIPAEIIVATLQKETGFGKKKGNIPIFNAINTQLFGLLGDSQRIKETLPKKAVDYMVGLLDYAIRKGIPPDKLKEMKGSFSGAYGVPQFMPFNFSYIVSATNKVPDISNNMDDVIMSVANFLQTDGNGKKYSKFTMDDVRKIPEPYGESGESAKSNTHPILQRIDKYNGRSDSHTVVKISLLL